MIIHILFQCVANLGLLSHVQVNTLVITKNQIVNRFSTRKGNTKNKSVFLEWITSIQLQMIKDCEYKFLKFVLVEFNKLSNNRYTNKLYQHEKLLTTINVDTNNVRVGSIWKKIFFNSTNLVSEYPEICYN